MMSSKHNLDNFLMTTSDKQMSSILIWYNIIWKLLIRSCRSTRKRIRMWVVESDYNNAREPFNSRISLRKITTDLIFIMIFCKLICSYMTILETIIQATDIGQEISTSSVDGQYIIRTRSAYWLWDKQLWT